MNSLWLKILVVVIIFVAEASCIFAEIMAAKNYSGVDASFWRVFLRIFIFMIMFSALIVCGYMLGLRAFKNIWIVSTISITSVLINEPVIAYAVFKQAPTKGALIGLILGALGLASALFYK